MATHSDKVKKKELFYFPDFLFSGISNGALFLNKLEEGDVYDPSKGKLLKNVHIFKDEDDTISFTGDMYEPKKLSSFLPFIKIIKNSELKKYYYKDTQVIYKGKNFSIIKKGYYLQKKLIKINPYLLNMRIIINNYSLDELDIEHCKPLDKENSHKWLPP